MVLRSPGGAELVIVCFVWVRSGWGLLRVEFPRRSSGSPSAEAGSAGDGHTQLHEL